MISEAMIKFNIHLNKLSSIKNKLNQAALSHPKGIKVEESIKKVDGLLNSIHTGLQEANQALVELKQLEAQIAKL